MTSTPPIILSLGSADADFQVRVDALPAPGQTAVATDFIRLSGGKAANVAFLARRLGVASRLLACVGDDRLGEQVLTPLADAGVDLTRVAVAPETMTGTAMIAVPPGGQKTILFAPNANDAWPRDAEAMIGRVIDTAAAGSILVADAEIPGRIVARALAACAARRLQVVLDPSPPSRVDPTWLARACAVTPNPFEARALTGIEVRDVDGAAAAARRLAARGVSLACVKLPGGGCVAAHADGIALVPAVPVRVVDATGAGDAFAGALAVALLEKQRPMDAARFATAAAHLAVTAYGSQPAYPDRRRLEAFLSSMPPVRDLAHAAD